VTSVSFEAAARAAPKVGPPVPLFPDTFGAATGRTRHVDYDVHPGGSRFLMVGSPPQSSSTDFAVVLGWLEELRHLTPSH
jgi:hypothetical protein